MNVYFSSLKGARPQNEDSHEIIINLDGKNTATKNVNFYSVYDGHGGKQVSNYLKRSHLVACKITLMNL